MVINESLRSIYRGMLSTICKAISFFDVLMLHINLSAAKKVFFKIGIHSIQGWTATMKHRVPRKRRTESLKEHGQSV